MAAVRPSGNFVSASLEDAVDAAVFVITGTTDTSIAVVHGS